MLKVSAKIRMLGYKYILARPLGRAFLFEGQ